MGKATTSETEAMNEVVSPVSVVINEAVERGYDLIFRIKEDGSLWDQFNIYYDLDKMKVKFSRVFNNHPDDARDSRPTRIYLLSNDEGDKGILVDADGLYNDARISTYIHKLQGIQQSIDTLDKGSKPGNRLIIAAVGLLLLGSAITFKIIRGRK